MKRRYSSPVLEVEELKWSDIICTSLTGVDEDPGNAGAAVELTNCVNHSNALYTAGSKVGLFAGGVGSNVTLTNCHSINYSGKNLVGDVTDNSTYSTCTRQNAAAVAGTKALTVAKVKELFLSDSANGHLICSTDSLPVLVAYKDEYAAGTVEAE